VLVDGTCSLEIAGAPISIRLGDAQPARDVLPEATFFRRYRETFAS
jgi:hypothetical protein